VLNASPRSRQNSLRLKPLASNSATKRSISARLRRRRTTHTCSSFMLLLHHQIHRRNRWVGLTLTNKISRKERKERKEKAETSTEPSLSLRLCAFARNLSLE
jgi:hypothetical protein